MGVKRRTFIQAGLAGSALLAFASCGPGASVNGPLDDARVYAFLSPSQRTVVAAIASAMLSASIPAGPTRLPALLATVRSFDSAAAGLIPSSQDELRQLLNLLQRPLTRWFTTGIASSWERAGDDTVAAFLTRWRFSNFTLFRSGYAGLHQLVMQSWYAYPRAWQAIGYPGPPKVG